MKSEENLLELKSEIEESKTTISELTGQKTALLKRLKDDWKCKSLREAKIKLAQMERNVDKLDAEIKTETEKLEEIIENEED